MAAFNKFNSFIEAVNEGKHDFSADTFKVMLTNTAPVATNSVKADLTEISAGNGYTAGGAVQAIASSSQTGGTFTAVMGASVSFTASGGAIGPLRYVVVYNDTATNDDLVGFYDYGSSVSLADGESLNFNSNGVTLIQMNSPA